MVNFIREIIARLFTKRALPYWCVLIADCTILVVAGIISTYICLGGNGIVHHFWQNIWSWIAILPTAIIGMRIFHTYSGILRFTTVTDLIRVAYALITGFIIAQILVFLLPENDIIKECPIAVQLLAFFLTLGGQWALRVAIKLLFDSIVVENKKRVIIYGVREGALTLARAFAITGSRYRLVGFISPDSNYVSKFLMGVRVRSDNPNLIRQIKAVRASAIVVSPLQIAHFREETELIDRLISNNIKIMVLPTAEEWEPGNEVGANQIQEVDIEDLLPRDKIKVDMQAIGEMLTNRTILITGAAGSIGSEMARQVAKYKPKTLILIDQAETPMHDLRLWMNNFFKDSNEQVTHVETIVGSINNQSHMELIFSKHRPEYVFHAAAYKHVPMMEDNPAMAVQNNIYGTRVIADLAVKYGTKKFVMISTDKAVNPTNVMGCSKRICEIYCQSLNKAIQDGTLQSNPNFQNVSNPQTQFITTRFGNVLGSNGSVIPIFREQIRKGGPLTVTHPDIIRFFMLIPEACQLVLEAGTMGNGGEIFVFDMGKPVRIADLAKRMIDLSGAKNVEIKYTGLRDGEKLYEEVLNDEELTKPTIHPKIKIASVREYPYDQALANEQELHELSLAYDDMTIVRKMKEIVPEYKSQNSKYETLD